MSINKIKEAGYTLPSANTNNGKKVLKDSRLTEPGYIPASIVYDVAATHDYIICDGCKVFTPKSKVVDISKHTNNNKVKQLVIKKNHLHYCSKCFKKVGN